MVIQLSACWSHSHLLVSQGPGKLTSDTASQSPPRDTLSTSGPAPQPMVHLSPLSKGVGRRKQAFVSVEHVAMPRGGRSLRHSAVALPRVCSWNGTGFGEPASTRNQAKHLLCAPRRGQPGYPVPGSIFSFIQYCPGALVTFLTESPETGQSGHSRNSLGGNSTGLQPVFRQRSHHQPPDCRRASLGLRSDTGVGATETGFLLVRAESC